MERDVSSLMPRRVVVLTRPATTPAVAPQSSASAQLTPGDAGFPGPGRFVSGRVILGMIAASPVAAVQSVT